MTEQQFFSLSGAAKATGKSKATLSNAIHSGRLSVHERTDKGYRIAASELFRVFAPNGSENGSRYRDRTPEPNGLNPPFSADNAVLQERIAGLERQLEQERETVADLRRRLDAEAEERRRLTALLTDQRNTAPQTPVSGRLARAWAILRGNA
ncbi:MAG: hypothetical protein SV201_14230 [Pseudomonadota bacterium]|nr:hypothetical protein [Pseudomonadota bacterium]